MKEMSLLQDPDAVEITGTIERVVFHNEENGYTVLRLMPGSVNSSGGDGGLTRPRESVSCVGHMVNPQAGVQMKISGRWVNNTRFGRQVEFSNAFGVHLPAKPALLPRATKVAAGPGQDAASFVTDFGRANALFWTSASGDAYATALSNVVKNGADPATEFGAAASKVNAELARVNA